MKIEDQGDYCTGFLMVDGWQMVKRAAVMLKINKK